MSRLGEFLMKMVYQVCILDEFPQIMIHLFIIIVIPIYIHNQDWSIALRSLRSGQFQ